MDRIEPVLGFQAGPEYTECFAYVRGLDEGPIFTMAFSAEHFPLAFSAEH